MMMNHIVRNRTGRGLLGAYFGVLVVLMSVCLPAVSQAVYDLYIFPSPLDGAEGDVTVPVGASSAVPFAADSASSITITADPVAGYMFSNWELVAGSGNVFIDDTNSVSTTVIPVGNVDDVWIVAHFLPSQHEVSIVILGDGTCNPLPPSRMINDGADQQFTAIETGTGLFHYWMVDDVIVSLDKIVHITVTNDFEITATFGSGELDQDEDGLPDRWEDRYGLSYANDSGINGPWGDPDNDGVVNLQEWMISHVYVTNAAGGVEASPINADSDGDGMDDGYEFFRIRDSLMSTGVVGVAMNAVAVVSPEGEYGKDGNPDGDFLWNTLNGYESDIGLVNMQEYIGPDDIVPGAWLPNPVVVTNADGVPLGELVYRFVANTNDTGDQSFSDTTDSEIASGNISGDGFDDGYEYSWDQWQGRYEGTLSRDPLGHRIPKRWGTPALPSSVVNGDFNQDGELDLAIANFGHDEVSILFGRGNGLFWSADVSNSWSVGEGPIAIEMNDFNVDGFYDLVTANKTTNTVTILYGDGAGNFSNRVDYFVGNYVPGSNLTCVAVSDFNYDNLPDIAVTHEGDGMLYILDGASSFTVVQSIDLGVGSRPHFVAAGLVYGSITNTTVDLVTANSGSNTISVILNDGSGVMNIFTNLVTGEEPMCVVIDDFTRDETNDIIVANLGSSTLQSFEGLGDGSFILPPLVSTLPSLSGPRYIASGQFDALLPIPNDNLDMVAALQQLNVAEVLLGSRWDASFSPASAVDTGLIPYWVTVADFNGDGLDDFAVVSRGNDNVLVFHGYGDGTFERSGDYDTAQVVVDRRFSPAAMHLPPPNSGRPDYDLIYGSDNAAVGGWLSADMEYTAWSATNVVWASTNGLLRREWPNRRRCTHPFLWDADSDQLPDGWELAFGYDPWDRDTDDNGVTDGDENPDGDWYAFVNAETNHHDVYLSLGFNPTTAYGYLFAKSNPDSQNNVEFVNVEELRGPRGMAAIMANDPDDKSTHPFKKDTDGDGIADGWEWYVGLDAKDLTDGSVDVNPGDTDGLSNFEEFESYYTSTNVFEDIFFVTNWQNKLRPCDPFDIDTDHDQLPDGAERAAFNFSEGMGEMHMTIDSNTSEVLFFYFTGGGLDPSTVDTDGDFLPDYWEASFPGGVTTNGVSTDGGMDGTSADAMGDPDGDGVLNYQEYLCGAVYHWQWMFNNGDPGWSYKINPVQGDYNPWDFFDSNRSGNNAMSFAGGREPKAWDPHYYASKPRGVVFKFLTAAEPTPLPWLFSTGFPDSFDTDADGMDDYYEIFHMLNPLSGVSFDRVLDKVTGVPDSVSIDFGPDLELYPFMNGWAYLDWDQDGLPNISESIQANADTPMYYHTDPSPYWMSDISYESSWVNMYYWLGPQMGRDAFWFWNSAVLNLGPEVPFDPPAYFFDFEMNEGFDTDNDGISDRSEIVDSLAGLGSTDPLDTESPFKRRALRLNGLAAARTQFGYTHYWGSFREFAVEAWVRADNPVSPDDQIIVERPGLVPNGNPQGYPSGIRLSFRLGLNTNGCPFVGYNGAGFDSIFEQAVAPIEQALKPDEWYHIAGVYNGNDKKLYLYVNGHLATVKATAEMPVGDWYGGDPDSPTPQTASAITFPIIVGASDAHPLAWIGGVKMSWSPHMYNRNIALPFPGLNSVELDPALDHFFSGYVDEIRIWDGPRSQTQIRANMNKIFRHTDVTGTSLYYLFGFDELPDIDHHGPAPVGFDLMVGYPNSYTYSPWWAKAPQVSKVYNDYRYIPWILNNATHDPLDPPSDSNIPHSSAGNTYPNTTNPYTYVYRTATSGGAEIHPFYTPPPTAENVYGDLLPLLWAKAESDIPMWDDGGIPSEGLYDSDGDGMPDDWEIANSLDPLNPSGIHGADGDRDEDGLSNIYEYWTENNPNSGDTDGDGISDVDEDFDGDGLSNKAELDIDTMPNRIDTDDDGLTDWEEVTEVTDTAYDVTRPNTSLPPEGITDPVSSLSPIVRRSMYFDGNSRMIVPPSNKLMAEEWSIEMWVRPDLTGDGGVLLCRHVLSLDGTDFGINYEMGLTTNAIAGYVRPYVRYAGTEVGEEVRVDGTQSTETSVYPVSIPVEEWSHLAATYSSIDHTLSLYVNGQLAAYRLDASFVPPTVYGYFNDHRGDEVTVGAYMSSGVVTNGYEGYIDEVRIWRGTRTAKDIEDRFDAPEANPTGSLKDAIVLKIRSWVPTAGISSVIMSQPADENMHMLVQFADEPTSQDILALQSTGANILSYVSSSVRVVSGTRTQVEAMGDTLRWVGVLQAEDKISKILNVDGSHASRTVLIQFFDDVPEATALSVVANSGASIVGDSKYLSLTYMLVDASDADVLALASNDAVTWILPAADQLTSGSFVHSCDGIAVGGAKLAPFTVVGDGWDGPGLGSADLLYNFMNVTPDLPEEEARGSVISQMQKWAGVAALTFTETPTVGLDYAIDIGWYSGDHGDGSPFDGPDGVLAHAFFPNDINPEPIAGDMHFDEDETWTIGPGMNLDFVSLHELGHALGLGHSDDPNAVMYPFYQDVANPSLTQDDIDGIQSIYGASAGSTTEFRFDDGGLTVEDFGVPEGWLNDWAYAGIMDGCVLSTNYFAPLFKDTDADGLPDIWEMGGGLDPYDPDGDNGAWGDPDMDGLHNIAEYWAGTDPMDSDSDDNGLGDYDSQSAPLMRTFGELYTDGDGIPDVWEINYLSDAPNSGKRGLDPVYYDAHLDPDEDGWSNYAEYMGSRLEGSNEIVRSSSPIDQTEYPEPIVSISVRYNGLLGDSIDAALLNAAAAVHVDFFKTEARDGFPIATLDMTTGVTNVREFTTGHLVEGVNYLFAYIDLDGSGSWDTTEPAGIAQQSPVIGWADVNNVEIGLTDESPASAYWRFSWADVGAPVYRVVMKNNGATNFVREIAGRNYFHEGDYLNEGIFGLSDSDSAYLALVSTNDPSVGWVSFETPFLLHRPEAISTPTFVTPHDYSPYAYARNEVEWTMDDRSSSYTLELATASNGVVIATVTKPMPFKDLNGVRKAVLPFYAGDTYGSGQEWVNGRYWMRLRSSSESDAVTTSSAWTQWSAFNLNIYTPELGGKSAIDGDIYYFGKVSRESTTSSTYIAGQHDLNIIIQAYRSSGFSSEPDAQVQLTYVCDINNPSPEKGLYEMLGLHSEWYYVRAFIDVNGNRKLDYFEPWGFAKEGVESSDYEPDGIDLTGVGSIRASNVRIVIRDRDTDDDDLPDGWEWMIWSSLMQGAYDDPDGDLAVNLTEYMDSAYDSDPSIADTDGDGVLDGYEIEHGMLTHRSDSDGDGLLDGFEVDNGLNPLSATADKDGDGVNDADEVLVINTDPNDADDVLRVLSLVIDENGDVALEWEGKEGVDYRVQYSTDLSQWIDVVDGDKTGVGTISYTGSLGISESTFFRVIAW